MLGTAWETRHYTISILLPHRMRSSLVRMRSSLVRMRSSLVRMRSSLVVRASDCQCTSCNGPGFDSSIRLHSGIWGAADEAVLNIVRKKKIPPKNIYKKNYYLTVTAQWKLVDQVSFHVSSCQPLPSRYVWWRKCLKVLKNDPGEGVCVVSIDNPVNPLHFHQFKFFLKNPDTLNSKKKNFSSKTSFHVFWPDHVASGVKKFDTAIFLWQKLDSGWCLPAIKSIAGVHIVEFYRSRDVFSSYLIYHFEDFTCILLVSIDSGKTHQKSPAHSSVFSGFFAKCVWQIFKTGCTITSPHPHPVYYTNMFFRFMLFRPSHKHRRGIGKRWN